MSLFNFLRSNKQTVSKELSTVQPSADVSAKTIAQDLFIDNEEPSSTTVAAKPKNILEQYIDQDFELIGYQDGYLYPEAEFLETKLRIIKADFRKVVDVCIDNMRTEVGELRLHKIKVSGMSSRIEAQLDEKIKILESLIHELDIQKVISIEDNGIISSAVHGYRLGFLKGVNRYQEEKLFAKSTGLFNN
jgi:hypothetical protein